MPGNAKLTRAAARRQRKTAILAGFVKTSPFGGCGVSIASHNMTCDGRKEIEKFAPGTGRLTSTSRKER